MAVFKTKDEKELVVTCKCGCCDGFHMVIDDDDKDAGIYTFMSYINGNFYSEQKNGVFSVIGRKLKKILAIICNKDYYYSEIVMSKADFEEFKEWVNKF